MRTGAALPVSPVTATLADAIVEMSRKGMGMTAIVDADGRIAGIFTDGDLRRCLDRVRDVAAVTVGDVMTRHPRTVRPEQLAVDCVETMEAPPKVSQLLVVDGHGAAGRRAAPARPLPRAGSSDADRRPGPRAPRPPPVVRRRRRAHRRPHLRRRPRPRDEGVLGARRRRASTSCARAGIAVAWITGSAAPAVAHRARRLGIAHVCLDVADKLAAWEALRQRLGLAPHECAHIGDDLPDVPVFHACGFAVTVPHAPATVREHAHYVTTRDGGAGAVREVAEFILAAQGHTLAGAPPRAA